MKRSIFALIAFVILFLIVCGQQGCEKQEARKGINVYLLTGIDYLSAGKLIEPEESFRVGIAIENYDKKQKQGQVCIRDSVSDSYGGIPSYGKGECSFFSVKEAEIKETKKGFGKALEIKPGTTKVYFPSSGYYAYHNIPEMLRPYQNTLYVSLLYSETVKATGTVEVPSQDVMVLNFDQDPGMVQMQVQKSVHKFGDAYEVRITINMFKQENATISLPDFSKPNALFFQASLGSIPLKCEANNKEIGNVVEFENEKFIRCSALVHLTGKQENYPLLIQLDYAVTLTKQFPFAIKTRT